MGLQLNAALAAASSISRAKPVVGGIISDVELSKEIRPYRTLTRSTSHKVRTVGRRSAPMLDTAIERRNWPSPFAFVRHMQTRNWPMSSIKHILPRLVLAAGMLLPGHVLADRAPTPQERSSIETMLHNEGFTRWGKIELDDHDDLGKPTTPMPPMAASTI